MLPKVMPMNGLRRQYCCTMRCGRYPKIISATNGLVQPKFFALLPGSRRGRRPNLFAPVWHGAFARPCIAALQAGKEYRC